MRLNKFIASTGYCSRRKADELIFNGQVKVNNEIILAPGYEVKDKDIVKVEDNILSLTNYKYYIFYKPINVLTSYDDSRGRKCLKDFDFFKKNNLAYSGRLDYKSEGLILFTNNGELIYKLQTPKFKVEKEYIVEVSKNLKEKERLTLEDGLKTVEYNYGKCKITEIEKGKYRVILTEGKNRQIRNMFNYFGIKVINLKRVRIGELKLNGLKPGEIKEIPEYIIKEYFNV
ncbi:pseudouridine synthase [Deferribacterales bacterium Es71-Z0220]|jgi:23S rRNA pseudouridine2605 synthase/23S rRNA pseudouridine2604 synthase|uniref:pseudouridine synthase n=1 Tax=Deferrivibrio essentukiensis TaxID=2880922 RepID=UPI001F60EE94|nr:pseudouridine synthase [Deferrivibrio essentukiensis]MBZ4671983.1 RNA-binding domain protein [Deferribacteraceae bacterium]MCB4204147.1 pseudouridine synthase [Deferrivibrio essentukiensis]